MEPACPACGAPLVPGPPSEVATEHGPFRVRLLNIPSLVCPAGCPTKKVSASDLLKHVFLLSRGMSAQVARKKGLFGTRVVCPRCGGELADAGSRRAFDFQEPSPAGPTLHLEVEGPSLDCRSCGAFFLPPFGSGPGLEDLTGAIAEAISKVEDAT